MLPSWWFIMTFYRQKRERNMSWMVSLDIQAVYDSVYIDGLIQNCAHLGINGSILCWINNFLACYQIKAAWHNSSSPAYHSVKSVLQGAVLSPILFTIFMAHFFEVLGFNVKCLVHADDIFMYVVKDTLKQCRQNIQEALWNISLWCHYRKLSICSDKCHPISFSWHKDDCDFQLTVNNDLIEWGK